LRSTLKLIALSIVAGAPSTARGEPLRQGKDFIEEAKLLYRVIACTDYQPAPEGLDQELVEAYCKRLRISMEMYQKNYIEGAEKFIAELRPKELPPVVVYPFGGGDLVSALTTYPDAKEITTISLEHAGDPRRIHNLDEERLGPSLTEMRSMAGGLLVWNDSKSVTLSKAQRNELPGQLSLFLIALAEHGFRPVSVRYFRLEPGGTIHYYEETEISALESKKANKLKAEWTSPEFSEAFSNSEIAFVRREAKDDRTDVRIHRHIAANLADANLKKDPSLLAHLNAKGKIAAMTKAASYLLWREEFSLIRNFLLEHMVFMVSDSTGIPPRYASKAGFVQEPFGTFESSFLGANVNHNRDFKKLWDDSPKRPLPFRYGYLDKSKHFHMLITRLAPK
jgi:hypothetical protein